MTISIGLMADNGIVLAADRQETAGYQKTDTGKISANFKPGKGSLIVTGAGSGTYLDSIAQQILASFSDDDKNKKSVEVAVALNTTNRRFYSETVIPFSSYPDHERPDYALLIGCDVVGSQPALFETDRLAFKSVDDYTAVGLGASTAKTLLSKFYIPRMPTPIAISLAAFVMYEVKASVEGCGLGTDVFYTADHVLQSVRDEEVLQMESAFHLFHLSERENLHYCIASGAALDSGSLETHTRQRNELRDLFSKLNRDRLRTLSPPVRGEIPRKP
jgi:predicted proteasome-type protease